MRNKTKKLLSIVAAAMFMSSAFALTGCGDDYYEGVKLTDYVASTNKAESNGGFVVEKDGFVYFINGAEEYTASNTYGDVVKGALMRISKTDLENGVYTNVKTVVPMLFVAQNFESGIYIYGDYVYYATPTRDKNLKGNVENTWLDFKRAKLDGTEVMKDYYFRLENNASNYRFVEENGTVYCLYEEDSALKSYNTKTGVHTVLVSGAKSSFFYDKKDLSNGNVYYTMSVVYEADSANPQTASYDQVYCVNAAATATVNAATASYTTSSGRTYDFDEAYLKAQNKAAKKKGEDEPYNLSDYTTYPYVNLGTLVLDGIGSSAAFTQYNNKAEETTATRAEPDGYTYTISRYENDGLYLTRTEVVKTSSETESSRLYYLSEARTEKSAIGDNAKLEVVAKDTTNASDSAIFERTQEGKHMYLYLVEDTLYKALPDANGVAKGMRLASLSGATLWKVEGNYLYYYSAGTNGNKLSRINYTGTEDDYKNLNPNRTKEEFSPVDLDYVDWNASWYKPEFVGNTVLYSNAQSFGKGTVSYNYIYTAKLGTTAELNALNEKYEAVNDYINDYSSSSDTQNLIKYTFGTDGAIEKATADLYDAKLLAEVQGKFKGETPELVKETAFINRLSVQTATDTEDIKQDWLDSLLQEEEEVTQEDKGLPAWAIWLIVVGSVLVVATAVTVPLVIVAKKKKEARKKAEAMVNAYKRKKIDTTDDKTIDVYADDKAEEATENAEAAEASAEEVVEEVPVEENAAEEAAEEASVEAAEEGTEAPAEDGVADAE